MPKHFDVAIVGSGPAGAACALRLAFAGYTVGLIDARDFPRRKLCGEYLNAGAIRELSELGLGDLESESEAVDGIRLAAHGNAAEISLPRRAWSIPRIILDDRIRTAAIRCGATPITARVRAITASNDGVQLEAVAEDEPLNISARYAVGADGMHSTVARALGLSIEVAQSPFAMGGHYATSSIGSTLEMYVGTEGYYAINPSRQSRVNVMFVFRERHLRRHGRELEKELERFSAVVSNERRALGDMVAQENRGAVGPLAHRTLALTKRNVILAGDAAAFVDPFTGQGIFLALTGARLAAAALVRALRSHGERDEAWRIYARDLGAEISRRRRLAWLVRTLVSNRAFALATNAAWQRNPKMFAPLVEAACGMRAMHS